MVNPETWKKLGADGQLEFNSLLRQFQTSLRSNGVHDGSDLDDWEVAESSDGRFTISNGHATLSNVTSNRRDVIEALFADGVGNLNR